MSALLFHDVLGLRRPARGGHARACKGENGQRRVARASVSSPGLAVDVSAAHAMCRRAWPAPVESRRHEFSGQAGFECVFWAGFASRAYAVGALPRHDVVPSGMALVIARRAGAGPLEEQDAGIPPASRDAAPVLRGMAFNGIQRLAAALLLPVLDVEIETQGSEGRLSVRFRVI